MFTKKHISAFMRSSLLIAFITGLFGLHPSQAVLAAGQGSNAAQTSLPDLVIVSVTPDPVDPEIGEEVTFEVVIKNQGEAIDNDSYFYVDFYIDQAFPTMCAVTGGAYWRIDGLDAGASTTVTTEPYEGFATDGLHTINGVVDTNCAISESNEDNNTWSGTMDWVAPTIDLNSVFTAADLGPASTEAQVTNSDPLLSGSPTNTFNAGDPIELYLNLNDGIDRARTVTGEWKVTGPNGEVVPELSSTTTHSFPSASDWWWWIDTTVPSHLPRGTYAYDGKITYNGVPATLSTTFTVTGSPAVESYDTFVTAGAVASAQPQLSSDPNAVNNSISTVNVGDKIQLYIDTYNDVADNEPASFQWQVLDPDGNAVPELAWSGDLNASSNHSWWYLPVTVPYAAAPGDYTFIGAITYAGHTTHSKAIFHVNEPIVNSIAPGSNNLNTPEALFIRRPTFQWQPAPVAANYTVEVVTAAYCSSFSTKLVNATVGSTSYTHTADLPVNTKFCWRVRVNVTSGPTVYSQIRSFTTGNKPTVPTLSAPGNGSLTRDYTPLFDWSNSTVTGATVAYYRIWVDNNIDFSSPEVNAIAYGSNYTPATDIAHNTKHYWKVQAVNLVGGNEYKSAWSATRNVRTLMDPPSLLLPTNDFHALTSRPSFDWDAPSGTGTISGYVIKISKNSTFTQVIRSASFIPSAYTPTTDLPRGIRLYWRVQAKGANGPSAWSQTRYFIIANPPGTPTLSSPAADALLTTTPLLQWSAVTVPTGTAFKYYQVQVDDNGDFATPVIDNTSITDRLVVQLQLVAPLSQNTQFYWRVRAMNTMNDASNWSAVRSFRTVIQAPSGLGVTLSGLQPSFDWTDATGPGSITNYTIQVSTMADFSVLLVNATTNMSDYAMLVDLPAGSTIYWRVSVNGTNGPSAWTATQFTTP